MPKHAAKPPFAARSQDLPAAQAAPAAGRGKPLRVTQALAERHEALWLSLTALHKDTVALGAKKPGAPVSEAVRIAAEGLLSDGLPFTRQRRDRFPVAAGDLAGLAVQLGQALAGLEAWESLNTSWDERYKCRVWRLDGSDLPVMRLKPPAAALKREKVDLTEVRRKLALRMQAGERLAYERGFEAGRAARTGAPGQEGEAEPEAGTGAVGLGTGPFQLR